VSQNPVAKILVAIVVDPTLSATHPIKEKRTMLIGYARVSTEDQKLHLQHDALRATGCEKIFDEKISGIGGLTARAELLDYTRRGDIAVVWKLDRLGRSLRDLVEIVNALKGRGVGLRSLHESIDTTTPSGKLTFHIFAALAEFERDALRERTRAGLAAARRRGSKLGRPRSLGPDQVEMARTLMANPKLSATQVAQQLGVHRSTLYRALGSRD
jgi:DNA invertase Pin-like site-specific DNA recombinase